MFVAGALGIKTTQVSIVYFGYDTYNMASLKQASTIWN